MSSGRDGADERFAAAGDVRMRGRAPGRRAQPGAFGAPLGDHELTGDQELEDDLRIADLLNRAGRATPGPDPETSRRMRADPPLRRHARYVFTKLQPPSRSGRNTWSFGVVAPRL